MAANTIKYFGNQTLDNSEMVSQKADTAEQNAKDYADGKFETQADAATAYATKADKSYVDNTFVPVADKLPANGASTTADMENAVNANKVPTADAIVHYVKDKTDNIDDKIAGKADSAVLALKADKDQVAKDIAFASVKVGESMDWFQYKVVQRSTHSDDPFTYTLDGEARTVNPVSRLVELQIADNVPEGWHAMDGVAELEAADYPELAAALPGNITNTGHIWIPYVPCRIIKVKY